MSPGTRRRMDPSDTTARNRKATGGSHRPGNEPLSPVSETVGMTKSGCVGSNCAVVSEIIRNQKQKSPDAHVESANGEKDEIV